MSGSADSSQNNYSEDFLARLQLLLDSQFESRRHIEKKAWDILTFSTGGITLGITLQIGLLNQHINNHFIGAVVTIFVLYLFLVFFVNEAIKPRDWIHVPGDVEAGPTAIKNKYVDKSLSEYQSQLFVDYVGKHGEKGAIQIAQEFNDIKAKSVNRAFFMMISITLVLVFATLSLGLPPSV